MNDFRCSGQFNLALPPPPHPRLTHLEHLAVAQAARATSSLLGRFLFEPRLLRLLPGRATLAARALGAPAPGRCRDASVALGRAASTLRDSGMLRWGLGSADLPDLPAVTAHPTAVSVGAALAALHLLQGAYLLIQLLQLRLRARSGLSTSTRIAAAVRTVAIAVAYIAAAIRQLQGSEQLLVLLLGATLAALSLPLGCHPAQPSIAYSRCRPNS